MNEIGQFGPLLVALIGAGAFAGVIAGLFGVGGGVVIVPALYYTLKVLGFPDQAMHVAVGTSLATIIATSVRSVLAHNEREAVDWSVLKGWTPFIVLGALAGAVIADNISGRELTIVFAVMAAILSAQFIFGRPSWKLAEDLPGGLPRAGIGGGIGIMSSLMGIGGGVFGVTLMTLCGRPVHQAVGTAAGFGAAIGLPGAIGYMVAGWGESGLPPFSIGFVSLPGFVFIALLTTALAPVGARIAHSMDAKLLKRLFGVLMALTAMNMLREMLLNGV